MAQANFRAFESREAAARALSVDLAEHLSKAVQARGRACLVASGGGSGKESYKHLAGFDLPWHQVSVLPSDERCVGEDSPRSNLGMIRRSLLVDARFIELNEATRIDPLLPFDVVLLGMGEDGHTASLFPSDPGIDAALASRSHVYRSWPHHLPEARISLTPLALQSAAAIFLLIFGAEKRLRFEAALKQGPASEYPVRILFEHEHLLVQVLWAP